MSRVPNAWDDDFESFADSKARQPPPAPRPAHAPAPRISRADRRAQHAEANRELWNSADNPETFHFVEATRDVPLASEAKPQLKVLSRKPKKPEPTTIAGLEHGVNGISIGGGHDLDDDPDSEEEARREQTRTLKERQEKARIEREEKQRRYNERREELFGSPTPATKEPNTGVSSSSPHNASPHNASGSGNTRGKPGRGGGRGNRSQGSHTPSSADQSPARTPQQNQKQLFEPGYSAKPDSVYLQRREAGRPSTPRESGVIRNPRGPDGSGRGGFGFAPRGRGKGP